MRLVKEALTDLRYTFRLFRSSVSFTLVAVGSMALGIGANSAIFSLVHAVLFDPYPYADAERIVVPTLVSERGRGAMSYLSADYLDILSDSETIEDAFASDSRQFVVTEGLSERASGRAVTSNFFDFMGVPAMLGRTFGANDIPSTADPPRIAVLSHLFWQRRFGGDPDVVGQSVELDREPYTILGVVPPRFTWTDADVYVPLKLVPGSPQYIRVRPRLKEGVSNVAAATEFELLTRRFVDRSPDAYRGFPEFQMEMPSVNESILGDFQGTLLILLAAVGCLLLIACGNVSILLLARASARRKEIAVRQSLGANRGRLIRQLLTESVVLSAIGGIFGVVLAYKGVPAIVALMPEYSIPHEAEIAVNGTVVLFSFAVAVCTGILFGMAPAFQLASSDTRDAMNESGRSMSGGSRVGRLRGLLVVAEVALTMVLLVGAGVAVRGLVALMETPLGFNPSNVVLLTAATMDGQYTTWQERHTYFAEVLEQLRSAPGVNSASVTVGGTPPYVGFPIPFERAGQAEPDPNQTALVGLIGSDFFSTVETPLLRGRIFTNAEVQRHDPVMLINEEMQQRYFSDVDPIGQVVQLSALAIERNPSLRLPPEADRAFNIIGVVAGSRNRGLTDPSEPGMFVPYSYLLPPSAQFLIRTATEPTSMIDTLRQQVLKADPDQPAAFVRTHDEYLDLTVRGYPQFSTSLFSIFAIVGLLLAASGLFSVVSYSVTRRTHEFGIRRALGASGGNILMLVTKVTVGLIIAGIVIGLGCIAALASVIQTYIVSWDPRDPVAFGAVILLLVGVSLAACWLPARRAISIQPSTALRHE